MLSNCRVVLVRPHYAGNVGAAARVMKNFGLRELVLVDPVANVAAHEARMLATRGADVLDAARVAADLGDAVADCGLVFATAGEVDGVIRDTARGTPDDLFPRLADALAAGPAALVFGPEPHGLTTAEVARCHALVHIPADPAYPSLNLAQSVAICLYELRKQHARVAATRGGANSPLAPFADQERMFDHLRHALEAVHFLWDAKAPAVWHGLRHLLGRSGLTASDVKTLHGVARQLLYVAGKLPPGTWKNWTPPPAPPPG